MSVAGEPSSSQAPAASPSPQAGDRASGAQQAPPETLFKQKVKWSWHCLSGTRDAQCVRSFTWDGNDTTRVKGDDSEETPETDRESDARIEQAARATRLQDDLLFLNDVVRQQVQQASDSL